MIRTWLRFRRNSAFTACRAACHDSIRRVSVETWTAIIAALLAIVALYFSVQSASAAVRPGDAAEKQTDIQEPVSEDFPQVFLSSGKSQSGPGLSSNSARD